MKRLSLILSLFTLASAFTASAQLSSEVTASNINVKVGVSATRPARAYFPAEYSSNPTNRYPLIFFFHGSGEGSDNYNQSLLTSTGMPYLIEHGMIPKATVSSVTYRYIVICIQMPPNQTVGIWGQQAQYKYVLDDIFSTYRIDTTRVYTTGLSLGAQSAWGMALDQPNRIAACANHAFTGYLNGGDDVATRTVANNYGVKLWTIVGSNDTNVGGTGTNPFNLSQTLINDYNFNSPSPAGIRTVISGGTHSANVWNVGADVTYRPNDYNVYEWFALYSKTPTLPVWDSNQKITITVTLSGTPNAGTKFAPAPMKYNKQAHFDFTQDDGYASGADAVAVMYGGVAPSNGVNYPGLTYTDGAGKAIKFAGSIARNSWANADTSSDFSVIGPGMTWAQIASAINKNWGILDHGAFHGIDQPGAVALGFNAMKNASANRNYLFRKSFEQGTPYVTRFGVVPSADINYHAVWEQMGYLGGTSQNAFDGYPAEPMADWANGGVGNCTNFLNDNRYHVQARRFKDVSGDAYIDYKNAIDILLSQSSATSYRTLSYGVHGLIADSLAKVMNYLQAQSNDRVLVCGLQEFYEYFEVARQTGIKQSLSGNVLTITLDQRFLPDETRWRDMSLLLNSNVSILSVAVTGADDFSYNTSTGLINIYKKKTTGFKTPPYYNNTGFVFNQKIALERRDFYIDNNYDNSPEQLIDGNTSNKYRARDFNGPMIYEPYDVVLDLTDYGAIVNKVRVYLLAGGLYNTKVILVRNDNDQEIEIGSFSQAGSAGWVDINVTESKFVASRLILRSTSTGDYGSELEVYADHLPYVEQTYARRPVPLGDELGVNAHWWNFTDNISQNNVENKILAFNALRLRSLRNYAPVDKYQNATGSQFAFNPVTQGWWEDKMMRRLKQDNPNLVRWSVLMGQSLAVKSSWDAAGKASQLNIMYANNNNAGRSNPNTWDSIARVAYFWAARKGNNKLATKFTPFTSSTDPWLNNNDSVGLGTSEWTELMNEPNAWWAGYDDYLNGQHLGLAWSKVYDNNKVYSANLGSRNADTSMLVSTSGLAINTVDLNRSAEQWARKNRGSIPKSDVPTQPNHWKARTFGWTDNPFDIIQYHSYSYTGGANQYAAGINSGMPYEISPAYQGALDFVWFRNKYAPTAKVDVGEWGFDINQNSPMNAPPIASYNKEQVRGAWSIRMMVEFNVQGIDCAQWFRLYQDNESDTANTIQFASMSLLKDNGDGTFSRRIVGDYFAQFSEFGDFIYDTTLSNNTVRIHRYKHDTSTLYIVWGVENMTVVPNQKPSFTMNTGTVNLPIAEGTKASVKSLQDGVVSMSSSIQTATASGLLVSYDLKPKFVLVGSSSGVTPPVIPND